MIKSIEYLLFESGISNYRISQDTGIAQSTLSDIATGKTPVNRIPLDNAIKLNNYYKEIMKMNPKYTVVAVNKVEYETKYGDLVEDQEGLTSSVAFSEKQALNKAKELYLTGKYNTIEINYGEGFFNPHTGINAEPYNFFDHYENDHIFE